MVMPISGYPAGQTARIGEVIAVLVHFNKRYTDDLPSGRARVMLVNLGGRSTEIRVAISVTYNSDVFHDHVAFNETLAPHSVEWREVSHEKFKAASFAKVALFTSDFRPRERSGQFAISDWPNAIRPSLVEEHIRD